VPRAKRASREVIEMIKELVREQIKSVLLIGLALALTIGMLYVMTGVAKAAGTTNPYPYGQSTYWAWQNRPDLPGNLGPAVNWDSGAVRQGFPVGPYPRKGDVAVFKPGMFGADSVGGHVAVVEQVLDDGKYIASEMLEQDCKQTSSACGQVKRQTYPIAKGMAFIHYKKDTRTTWGFASGASGWTARDLGEGSMGGPGWYYPVAGSDPQLVSPELEIPLDGYNAVEVDMVTGIPVTNATIQIYFATADKPDFVAARSVTMKGKADGVLHTYVAYFGSNTDWKGTLTRLRLDPAGPGKTGGVRIDRVRLVSLEQGQGEYTALTEREWPVPAGDRTRFAI
jgi:surface antigen